MRSMARGALALALVALAPHVQAATVRYDYTGVVDYCDDAALGGGICGVLVSLGDLIYGWAEIDSTGGVANRTFGASDVLGYLVGLSGSAFGGATPDNSVIDPASVMYTDADSMIVDGELGILVDPTLLPISIEADLAADRWEIILFPGQLDLAVVGGSGSFGAPVPLPGALWLLASALLLVARRGGRSTGSAPLA